MIWTDRGDAERKAREVIGEIRAGSFDPGAYEN